MTGRREQVRRGGFNGMTSRANSLVFEPSCNKNLKYVPGGIPEPNTTLALRGQFKSVQKLIGSCKSPDIAKRHPVPDCGETRWRTEDYLLASVSD